MRWNRIPVRIQLAVWYVLLLALTLGSTAGYLYFRLERKLMVKADTALQIASAQSLVYLDQKTVLAFEQTPGQRQTASRLSQLGLAARLITPTGQVIDGFGRYQDVPIRVPNTGGYMTIATEGIDWRLISQPVIRSGRTIGWFQIAQSLEPLEDIAQELPTELLLNLPLILIVTVLGGLFLSNRALSPIREITRTAQAITATDLSQRIHYQGASDEVGQLAITFDQMLDRLQGAFDREQRFTADAAHELRTPLTVIKGQLEVTQSRLRSQEEYNQTLQKLGQEVDRLIRLTNGLLLLAKIDQGQLPFEMQRVNLSDLLEVIVEQIQPLADAKEITVITDLVPELWVKGDPDHLTSSFLNLLDNAVKYAPNTGVVRLCSGIQGREIQIDVSNTGSGISAEHLPYLFERFYRVDSARLQSGAGLGLAIVQEMIRRHRGTIEASSQSGITTFTVQLPIA
ncbi:integral membrane sensor signal transduction histidine kinase [Leptolyngbya sp. NIES-3755]|nr:integral membrane sensor signal transduction histidine kinase [Leptolyngbya sp. NIES-3755]